MVIVDSFKVCLQFAYVEMNEAETQKDYYGELVSALIENTYNNIHPNQTGIEVTRKQKLLIG